MLLQWMFSQYRTFIIKTAPLIHIKKKGRRVLKVIRIRFDPNKRLVFLWFKSNGVSIYNFSVKIIIIFYPGCMIKHVSLLLISSCMMKLLLSSRALSVKLKSKKWFAYFCFAKIVVFRFDCYQALPSIISLFVQLNYVFFVYDSCLNFMYVWCHRLFM